MLRTALAALAALAASSCASYPTVPEAAIPDDVSVAKFTCTMGAQSLEKVATVTEVDGAVLTAAHVVLGCNEKTPSVVFDDYDLAILEASPMQSCRPPKAGERVLFQGYPMTFKSGTKTRDFISLERDLGRVLEPKIDAVYAFTPRGTLQPLKDQATTTHSALRGGYSGGSVTSVETGEFLGIITAARMDVAFGSFVPADVICEKMEEVL